MALFGYAGVFDEYLGDGKVLRRWKREIINTSQISYTPYGVGFIDANVAVIYIFTSKVGARNSNQILIGYPIVATGGGYWYKELEANKIYYGDITSNSGTQKFFYGVDRNIAGWISSITPNDDEVKAYFNGWKATANDGSRYTAWEAIGDSSITSTDINYVSTTKVTDAAGYSGNWKPYEIIYQLATPQIEEIQPSGELNLYPGDNYIIAPDFSVLEISGQPKYMNG